MASERPSAADAGTTPPRATDRSPAVVVVGSANRDYVCRVASIPLAGETVLGAELSLGSGGKGGNQAVAASLMGAPTALVACVGADADGRALVADLVAAGVDVRGVRTVEGVRSGAAFVMVADDGENSIVVAPGANGRLGADAARDALEGRLRSGDVLMVQAEIPADGVAEAAARAERVGARVVLNLAPYRPVSDALLRVCDPLVVNELEARALLGLAPDDPMSAEAMAAHLGRRTRSAVVTLGSAGAVVAAGDSSQLVPAVPVPVVDTTGAGDAFTGAMAAALCTGAELAAAARLGVAAGSYAVGRVGAQASYPRRQDLGAS